MPPPLPPRLSGHETFACRFTWLPKVVKELNATDEDANLLFKDENSAMVRLGVGKNMVRSIRFWAEVSGIIEPLSKGGHSVTEFGNRLLGYEGHDPYLERQETLWLLHWKIATSTPAVYYWQQILNFWHRPDFCFSEIYSFLERGLPANSQSRSKRTIGDGFKVFIHTYVPTRGRKGEIMEDNLDCPFVELGLIKATGSRSDVISGKNELIYSFNYDNKPDVTDALFAYCINDYWDKSHHTGETLDFRSISSAEGSPGQIFKLPELAIRFKLEQLLQASMGAFEFMESSTIQQIVRKKEVESISLLDNIYI